jgi:hypothetical protein
MKLSNNLLIAAAIAGAVTTYATTAWAETSRARPARRPRSKAWRAATRGMRPQSFAGFVTALAS